METILITGFAYFLVGFVVLGLASRGTAFQLEEYSFLVVLAWPFFLVLQLVEWGLAPRRGAREPQRLPQEPVVVGQVGVAVSDLCPTGKVALAGRTLDARAENFVAQGAAVVVVSTAGFELLVQAVEPKTERGDSPEPTVR